MAITPDAAFPVIEDVACASTVMQLGNDNANTPTPTWTTSFAIVAAQTDVHVETFDTDGSATPAVLTAVNPVNVDQSAFWLDSVDATARF